MDRLDLFEEDSSDTVFRDVVFLALAGFVAIVMLLLPLINPPAKAEAEVNSPGNLIVEMHWPDDAKADLDLWVEAPGDVPVGYSNKSGTIFNLLRDDLGDLRDVTNANYEVSYSRGLPAGEYTTNVHLYRALQAELPILVTVVVSVKASPDQGAKKILDKKLLLRRVNEELTVLRFTLDEDGSLLSGSVHDLPRPLRAKKS